jgi:hypothetical protein
MIRKELIKNKFKNLQISQKSYFFGVIFPEDLFYKSKYWVLLFRRARVMSKSTR